MRLGLEALPAHSRNLAALKGRSIMDDEKKVSDLMKALGMVEDAVELATGWLESDNQKGAMTSLAIANDALSLARMRVWKVEAAEVYLRDKISSLEADIAALTLGTAGWTGVLSPPGSDPAKKKYLVVGDRGNWAGALLPHPYPIGRKRGIATREEAHRFESLEEALEEAKAWDGGAVVDCWGDE
jgi:hypothetical protein